MSKRRREGEGAEVVCVREMCMDVSEQEAEEVSMREDAACLIKRREARRGGG